MPRPAHVKTSETTALVRSSTNRSLSPTRSYRLPCLIGWLAALTLICAPVWAVQVQVTVTGTVNNMTDPNGVLGGQGIGAGSTFTAVIQYDTTDLPWNSQPGFGFAQYWPDYTFDVGLLHMQGGVGGTGLVIEDNRFGTWDGFDLGVNHPATLGGNPWLPNAGLSLWWRNMVGGGWANGIGLPAADQVEQLYANRTAENAVFSGAIGADQWFIVLTIESVVATSTPSTPVPEGAPTALLLALGSLALAARLQNQPTRVAA